MGAYTRHSTPFLKLSYFDFILGSEDAGAWKKLRTEKIIQIPFFVFELC